MMRDASVVTFRCSQRSVWLSRTRRPELKQHELREREPSELQIQLPMKCCAPRAPTLSPPVSPTGILTRYTICLTNVHDSDNRRWRHSWLRGRAGRSARLD